MLSEVRKKGVLHQLNFLHRKKIFFYSPTVQRRLSYRVLYCPNQRLEYKLASTVKSFNKKLFLYPIVLKELKFSSSI